MHGIQFTDCASSWVASSFLWVVHMAAPMKCKNVTRSDKIVLQPRNIHVHIMVARYHLICGSYSLF